jgi:hypothetical protein
MTPKTAAITDAKAGFHARAKQQAGSGLSSPYVLVPDSPPLRDAAPTPFPTPARPALPQGEASYERRPLNKSLGPGSGRPPVEGAPRPASVIVPSAVSPVASEVQTPGMQHKARIEAQFVALLVRSVVPISEYG